LRDAGSAGHEVYGAEHYRLSAVAAVLFPAGHSGGAAIDIPADEQSGNFKWLLLLAAVLLWLAFWLCWRLWRSGKAGLDRLTAICRVADCSGWRRC
jgi:hypothetical protein